MEDTETQELVRETGGLIEVDRWDQWASHLLSQVDCGDTRRDDRLVSLLSAMAQQPGKSLPQQCKHEASLKATYRLLGGGAVQPAQIMQSAAITTLETLQSRSYAGVLLAVQDTTTLNFSTHESLQGRGPIGSTAQTQGFHAHSTLLLGEEGIVHGLLQCEVYARDTAAQRARKPGERNRQSAQQKESHRWVRSLQHSAQAVAELGQAQAIINIADREADMYELFLEAMKLHREQEGRVHLLVRAQHDRELQGECLRMWEQFGQQPAQVCWEIELPAPKGIHGRQKRHVEALWQSITLAAPAHQRKYQGHEQSVTLNVIVVREPNAPAGQDALEWVLLTTWPVADAQAAMRVAGWYALRWQIEVMHRVWKSGCKVEKRQLQSAQGSQVMIVLDLLIAVRIMGMVSLARQAPEAPVDGWLTPAEQSVLRARYESAKTDTAGKPMQMGQALRWIARLGGHGSAPSRPPPGAETLWRGLTRLHDMTEGWLLVHNLDKCG